MTVYLLEILHRKKFREGQRNEPILLFMFLLWFFYARHSINKREVHLAKEKVTLRIKEGELVLLKVKYNTDNQSEAIRLAISKCLLNEERTD